MKYLLAQLFKPEVLDRLERIREKQAKRLERVHYAVRELDKNQDMNINELYPMICRILKIKNNKGARHFITGLVISKSTLEQDAKKLPLI